MAIDYHIKELIFIYEKEWPENFFLPIYKS